MWFEACACCRAEEAKRTVVGVVGKSITLRCDIPHADPPVVIWEDKVSTCFNYTFFHVLRCITFLTRYSYVVKRVYGTILSSVCLSVRNGCIVAKRCEIWPKLLLIINRKSHSLFQMKWKSSTLGDFEDQYCNRSCSEFLATAGLFC